MSHPEPTTPMTRQERILQSVRHLEHVVPAQAPLTDFVHHNTLHGFQHLPFPQALAAARKVTGIFPFLSSTRFRALRKEGRIDREDLEAVIAKDPDLTTNAPLGPTTRGEIVRLVMENEIKPLTALQLAWEIEEQNVLTRPHPDVKASYTAQEVTDLWQAALERFELHHSDWYKEERLDLSAEEESLFPTDDALRATHEDQGKIIGQIRQAADYLWCELRDQVGDTLTLRGFLLALTGEDILEAFRPYLLRVLASFLDLGVAGWSLPARESGFYLAWKGCATREQVFALEEMPAWCAEIADLPDTAMEAVEACLSQLGLPEERWGGYLERLAMEIPGWSGMMMWRSLRPGYQGMRSLVRVEMLDYLAVRLVLERLFAKHLCQARWQVEPSLETLGWYFRRYRGEFYVRWTLFNGELPEFFATRATRLLHRASEEPKVVREWQKLAYQIWTGEQLNPTYKFTSGQGARGKAWPIFLLAQHLGLRGNGVRQISSAQAEEMLALIAQLTDEKMGFLWLQAYERHYRNQIFSALTANHGRGRWARREKRPQAQVIFCMDDREEGIRRHLEERVPAMETLGAAGFFGVPINWLGVDDQTPTALCPVVVIPSHDIHEQPAPGSELLHAVHRRKQSFLAGCKSLLFRESHRGLLVPTLLTLIAAPMTLLTLVGKVLAPRAWGRMTRKVVISLDSLPPTSLTLTALEDGKPATPAQPRLGFSDSEQEARVTGFLRTIGLTYGFSPLVAILGHGSSSQNNPHLAAYDCGACSGRHGGPNARLFAALANRPQVRARLQAVGIEIPPDTWFIGGEHNTGNETIVWFDQDLVPKEHQEPLVALTLELNAARAASAHERARRLASAPRNPTHQAALSHMEGRGVDFSQARPELGHATNAVALIGRRSVTRGAFFDRRMFLISYDPTDDPDGKIVEGILLAAGPVGAGISLEYYFSTVDNDRFGCGTKVVHNVTGMFGVMEGSSSDLRTGLPQQMIEIHEAMRLLVVVEQRPQILTAIYHRQAEIRELVGNGWIILATIDPESGVIHQFEPAIGWLPWTDAAPPVPVVKNSSAWYAGHSGPLPPALIVVEN